MVSKQIVGIFFRYKTLMSIKWFESVIWLEKRGISSHVLSFLSNAESMTYVLCIKVRRILWKKKKKETTLLTIICLVRRVLRILCSWISDQFIYFEYEYRREDRLITFYIKKEYVNSQKEFNKLSVRAKWIERFMFGSGRDRGSFEMNGKIIYFH